MSKSQLEDLLEQIVSWSCSSLYLSIYDVNIRKKFMQSCFLSNCQHPIPKPYHTEPSGKQNLVNLRSFSLLFSKIGVNFYWYLCSHLDDNFIRRIRPISKWTHSPLVYFGLSKIISDIGNNPIRDIEELAIFNAKKLSTLQL